MLSLQQEGYIFSFKTARMILVGNGAIEKIPEEVEKLSTKKPLIVTDKGIVTSGIVGKLTEVLEGSGIKVDILDDVEAEPSTEFVSKCVRKVMDKGYDLIIGLGGGSCMDVAKIISVMLTNGGSIYDYIGVEKIPKAGLPTILIPTTSGTGSEVTPNAIVTNKKEQLKQGIVSHYLLPHLAVVDPSLTISLPAKLTAYTGMDALTHSIESYVSANASPLSDIVALESIRLISRSLRNAVNNGGDIKARYDMSLGSLLGGIALSNAGTGGVHALAYPLGGRFGIPHGLANALMLRYVIKFNIPGNPVKFARIAREMGEDVEGLSAEEAAKKAQEAVSKISDDVGIPKRLRDVGIPKEALAKLAESASKVSRLLANNPRQMRVEDIREIYEEAF